MIKSDGPVELLDVEVSNNAGAGIVAKFGFTEGIDPEEQPAVFIEGVNNKVNDNGKGGIVVDAGGNINISEGVIEVMNNKGYGIFTRDGSVWINMDVETGTVVHEGQTSQVSSNNRDGIRANRRSGAAGQAGNVQVSNLKVVMNKGVGIKAAGDLVIEDSEVCQNEKGDIKGLPKNNLNTSMQKQSLFQEFSGRTISELTNLFFGSA